ncbi:hypothetical protein BKP45_19025 [Anaerobacillus alkalidiazotrophicus]|uniref:Sulfotransferase family protein n=1 Tax=Anaerobacillus alkalidiazotrophicus TaxID=472963 RepID=A0A1S2M1E8_9BACI|nr:sulfotransferase family 2 domain-containing protein [Anaerobacillus alkalidiazotrophicus]OIJ18538.1 hypothetical protein BKP45_19025 [Anaerobacillus alkalidiazotrophicus]
MDKNNDLLIFLHIPKTGGTTLRKIVEAQYKPNEIITFSNREFLDEKIRYMPSKELDRIKCLQGHSQFGIHSYIQKSFKYITFLRDPIESMISLYYYVRNNPKQPMYKIALDNSLEEFIDIVEHNRFTWYLSGTSSVDIEKAKENLNNFHMVGITEMYEESLFLMMKSLNWKNIRYKKRNVNSNRPSSRLVPPKIINKISEKNQLDLNIYYHAKKSLQKRIDLLDQATKVELKKFQKIFKNEF